MNSDNSTEHSFRPSRRLQAGGVLLGVSIGGFFDGILLHQILQWHHLLSGMQGGRFDNLRLQILADGLFHALMYALAGIGLWLLWRCRAELAVPRASGLLLANALVGFGAWHIVDGIVSHWLLGIHRIRMDSDYPLFWDVVWFLAFGILFAALGWRTRRHAQAGARTTRGVAGVLAALAILGGAGAISPPAGQAGSVAVVVFMPGTTPAQAMSATNRAGGRLVWADRHDSVWAIDLPGDADRTILYRGGALLVGNSWLPVGCLNWFKRPQEDGSEV